VFLPTKSPDLNLIEVRWIWLQRKAINNSIFKTKSDIGKVVQDWTTNYNQTHMKTITNILFIYITVNIIIFRDSYKIKVWYSVRKKETLFYDCD
jgi:transposase